MLLFTSIGLFLTSGLMLMSSSSPAILEAAAITMALSGWGVVMALVITRMKEGF